MAATPVERLKRAPAWGAGRRLDPAAFGAAGSHVLGYVGTGAAYLAAYVALDWISFIHAWSVFGFTLWNPPPALSLALVATRGPAYIPLIFVALLICENVVRASILGTTTSLAYALVLTAGYGGLGVLLRYAGPVDLLRGRMREAVLILLLIPAGVLVVAMAFVATFAAFGFFLPADYFHAVRAFWVGDVSGILAVLPALLIVLDPDRRWVRRMQGSAIDLAVFALLLLVSIWLVFVAGFVNELRFFYLLFVPIIWIAIRRGITGAAIGVLAVQSSVAAAVLLRGYTSDTFLAFQAFFVILDGTGLLLGAVVTARYQAELRLRKQQAEIDRVARMTTVGVMGSALAHQISQPLASIATHAHTAQLLLMRADAASTERVRKTLDEISHETERAGQALRQLRDFVADGRIEKSEVDVLELLEKVATLLRRQHASSSIALNIVPNVVPKVFADPIQLEQVLINVISNGIEATQSWRTRGAVTVAIRQAEHSVEILVEDQGPGIAPEIAQRLFEPFVTSKSHGMGLGLAICRAVMKAHGGGIEHHPLGENGTRFTIRLPLGRQ
jgi:signal transduction histidine kinase